MRSLSEQDVTALLHAWKLGEDEALPKLVPLVYAELHRLARKQMAGERAGHILETTALVNEAYLRIARLHEIDWTDRNHFYAISSRLMRRILVDFARARSAEKRGGGREQISLKDEMLREAASELDLVALDQALDSLAVIDQRKAQVVELRFFGGLTVRQTADLLKVAPATVMRDWDFSKAWLHQRLENRTESIR